MKRVLASVVVLAVLFACEQKDSPLDLDPSFLIQDAVHSQGNANFFWLPPMVEAVEPGGVFDGTVEPEVEICELNQDACVLPLVAGFSMTTGPGSETIRLMPEDELFIVNWHTDAFGLDAAKTYRIKVLVSGQELGLADVDVVEGGNQLKNVNTQQLIPLKDGRTLPIKFRIEEGAVEPEYWNLLKEDFDHDVFFEGWYSSDASVAVNLTDEVLRIGSGSGILGDWAQVDFVADLPITLQSRMRLRSGGQNYRLPHFTVGYGSSMNEGVITTYLEGNIVHGWGLGPAEDRWTYLTTNSPSGEDVWVTLTLEVRTDGATLYSMLDHQSTKTWVAFKDWPIPAQTTALYFIQPWDAVCEFDYIYARSGLVN